VWQPHNPSGGLLSALRHRNFRLYFAVQVISNVGTWVQIADIPYWQRHQSS